MVQKFKKRSLPIELKGNNLRLKCAFVSTMDQYYFDSFGCFMIDSFLKNTPDNFVLHLYAENIKDNLPKTDKIKIYDWNHVCLKNWKDFCNKTQNKKEVKFAKKGFAFLHALENIKADYITWIDADIFFKQKIDTSFLNYACSKKYLIGLFSHDYLDLGISAESGFVVVNQNHTDYKDFVEQYKLAYKEKPKEIQRWYDGQVCMYAAKQFKNVNDLSFTMYDVDTHTPLNHCPMNKFLYHEKGPTKKSLVSGYFERLIE